MLFSLAEEDLETQGGEITKLDSAVQLWIAHSSLQPSRWLGPCATAPAPHGLRG